MSVSAPSSEQRILLHGVSWETYERLVDELEEHPGVRLTYDRGVLELMSPSYAHDWIKKLLGRIVEALSLELAIPIKSGGSTTFRRRDLERGLEPDECYWVQSEPQVRGKSVLDLAVDPAPDLVIEVEVTENVVDKLPIYAALGVGEVWRHDGERLRVLRRAASGEYEPAERSAAFPMLPLEEVDRLLARREETDETSLLRAFQEWVRDHLSGS